MADEPADPRPRPRYGEYADPPPPAAAPVTPPPPDPATRLGGPVAPVPESESEAPRRSVGDTVITTILLLIGVFDVVSQWPQYAALGVSLREVYATQDFGDFTSVDLADQVGVAINIARTAVLVITILAALVRIQRGRRAFWIPLVGAAAAYLATFALLLYVMASDPALAEYVRTSTGG